METTEKQLTLFTADFHASSPSAWLVTRKDKTTIDTFGLNFRAWSPKLDLVGSLLKTFLVSCELPLMTFARTWSVSATPLGFGVMKLRLSAHCTEECGCSLWRTPLAQERTRAKPQSGQQVHLSDQVQGFWRTPDAGCARGAQSKERFAKSVKKHRLLTLNDQVAHLFPTPRAADGDKGTRSPDGARKEVRRGHRVDLPCYVQLYPTPTCNDAKNNNPPSQRTENGRHSDQLNVVAGGALNPDWVEWLMGFPIGWTADIGG
jgi:hypothetical protein